MGKYGLYLTFDNKFIDGALVTIYSFITNNPWFNGDIIVGCSDEYGMELSEKNRERVKKIYNNVIFININSDQIFYKTLNNVIDEKQKQRFGPFCYKFHAFTMSEYDKIVIIDSDFLVLGDISELFFNEEIKFGATIDFLYKKEQKFYLKRDDEYFNVGIMVVDKEYLNKDILNDAIVAIKNNLLEENGDIFTFKGKYFEQDLLNLILYKKDVTLLPTHFNGDGRSLESNCDDCKCIHYWSELKPWVERKLLFKPWRKWFEYEFNMNSSIFGIKNKIMLCCIGRLENLYIREYVEYYKKLGVDNICLFDNNYDGDEDFRDVIGDYIDSGFVILKDYRNQKVCQLRAYDECYKTYGGEYDWIMFFDIDEFMFINGGKNLNEYLSMPEFFKYDMIHINWMLFGDGGNLRNDGRPLLNRITKPLDFNIKASYNFPDNFHIKSIIRGGLSNVLWNHTPHTPTNNIKCCNASGNECNCSSPFEPYDYRKAGLVHFTTKTAEEYSIKVKRGFPDGNPTTKTKMLELFFKRNEITREKIDLFNKELGIDMSYLLPYNGNKNKDVQIFSLCYDKKNFNFLNDYVITPLQVGSANGKDVCDLKDNTGDNISEKNYFYIENTGTYWIWKNIKDAKYKGQMQYRRPLDGVNETMNFDNIFSKYKVITCEPFNHPANSRPSEETPMFIPANTVEEGYAFSNCIDDLKVIEMVINIYHPEYKESYDRFIKNGENLYYSNGFIMNADNYDKYCEFLFDCLEKYQQFVDVSTPKKLKDRVVYNMEVGKYPKHVNKQSRTEEAIKWQMSIGGFLSERIWTLWLLHNFKDEEILKLPYNKMENNMYT